ncbi:HupE/UreJ family protein [Calothrix membranacea FACHB-236]|nr:HupE/UreJ family protein [Calothrix membranacea FACHB-236]
MLTIELSTSATALKRRYAGAIAALILLSLLCSLSGLPIHQSISNCWEGLLWGIADPVVSLNSLASLVAIGLFCAGMNRGVLIAASFLSASVLGIVIHLFYVNLVGAEIGIAASTIAVGTMLMMSIQPNWLLLSVLGAIAGLFHGYAGAESIINTEILPLIIYVLGFTVTQCAVIMSAREIYPMLLNKIGFVGLAVCAISMAFLSNTFHSVIFSFLG